MANYLVTGGAGFIGSHLATELVARGHRVRVMDNFATGRRENIEHVRERIDLHESDLRSMDDCLRACEDIEVVFHQAAIPSVPRSVENPIETSEVNIGGTLNLLLAAHRRKCRRVVYAASSSAYGNTQESPKHEEIIPRPLSPYAVQKYTGETYCRAFYECYGLETLSLRYFNVFGPRQDPNSQYAAVIPAFVTAMLADKSPTIYGDGEQTRDFTYIDNVVNGNILAAEAPAARGEAINVACGDRISVNAIVSRINEILGKDIAPIYAPARKGDVKHSQADIALARKLLNFSPLVTFDEGLRRAAAHYRELASGKRCRD